MKPDSNPFYKNFYRMDYSFLKGALEFRTLAVPLETMKGKEPGKTPVRFEYFKGSREKGIIWGGHRILLDSRQCYPCI